MRRRFAAAAASGLVLTAVLGGCGSSSDAGSSAPASAAPPSASVSPADPAAGAGPGDGGTASTGSAAPGTVDGAAATQIEDAVTQARATLDQLDQELQGDTAALTP